MLNKKILKLNSVTYNIQKTKDLVKDISFDILSGDLVSIIGPNGSGKSTLIKLISGELSASSGSIFFLNKEIKDWSLEKMANCRAVLSQSNYLSFPFSVLNIVKMGRYPIARTDKDSLEDDICIQILNDFDLSNHIEQNYTTLSGGEKQRVQLSRIFAQIHSDNNYDGKILLLDEPTSYLDIKHQQVLFELIKGMNQKGLTIIMVLHDLNHAVMHSNKIIMMKNSEVISFGESKDVVNEENLSKVFDINLKLIYNKDIQKPIIVNLN